MKKRIIAAAAKWFIAAGFAQVGDLLKKAKEKVQNNTKIN